MTLALRSGGWCIRALWLASLSLTALACSDSTPPDQGDAQFDLVFEGRLENLQELMVRDGDGTARRWLAHQTTVQDPAPSPDGSRIAFVVFDPADGNSEIFVMNRDGSGVTQLTFDPETDDQPAWSPDGTRIAFRSFRTQLDGDIWVMNADGSNPVNLTPDPVPAIFDMRRPAWSPDGSRIAFGSPEGGTSDIWTMKPDGSDKVQLTSTEDLDTEPAWSPDGSSIVFRRSYFSTPTSDLAVVHVSTKVTSVVVRSGHERMPVYSPDGSRIVFVAHPTVAARPDLYDMDTGGGDLRELVSTQVPGGSLNPTFIKRRP